MNTRPCSDLHAQTWWHGSPTPMEAINWSHPIQGGLHVGTIAQARTRGPILTPFHLAPHAKIRRTRDRGGQWKARAQDARSRGFDALLYLNRYEGIGQFPDIGADWDALSDQAFLRHLPHATHSLLVLRAGVLIPAAAHASIPDAA